MTGQDGTQPGRGRRLTGAVIQILGVLGFVLLMVWAWVVLGVYCTYSHACDPQMTGAAGIRLESPMLPYLWLAIWCPAHLLVAAVLLGRLMCRSVPDRNASSDRSR